MGDIFTAQTFWICFIVPFLARIYINAIVNSYATLALAPSLPPLSSRDVNLKHQPKKSIFIESRLWLGESCNSVLESASGEMVLADDGRLLNAAFSALDDSDKYDTVLTGLCAKVIDGAPRDAASAKKGLVDPIRLMEEMNSGGIVAKQRGVVSLLDATALTADAKIMAKVLSLFMKNGAITNFGHMQGSVTLFPRSQTISFFGNNNGNPVKRLETLPAVPEDDRAAEVTSAVIFSTVVASCLGINIFGGLFGLEDLTPLTNLILWLAVTTVVLDNFFDLIVSGGSALAKMNEEKLPHGAKTFIAPKKEDMPLGIGTGSVTGTVVRGLSRLLSVNTERDCQCEAAAVFMAYSLGLPCFAFQPNSLEGSALVVESMRKELDDGDDLNLHGALDDLSSDVGLMKVLMWLLAPVAMEMSKFPQLISSDPREARSFLKRLCDKSGLTDIFPTDDEVTDKYLRWALAETDLLLRSNRKTVEALSEALVGGAATVGDCVAIIEGW